MLKRSPTAKVHACKRETGGGHVEFGETFEQALHREMKEELGIVVKIVGIVDTYVIQNPHKIQQQIPGLVFVCSVDGFLYNDGPVISDEHTEWKLVGKDELDDYDLIDGIKEEIEQAYEMYEKSLIE